MQRFGDRDRVRCDPGHRIGECLELDTLAVYPGELKPFDPAVDIADVQQVMIEQ